MFLCRIFIWPCDLVLRPIDLGDVWRIKSLIHQTYLLILSVLRLSVPELCVTQSDHITITWNGHYACVMSRDLSPGGGSKMIHIFEILTLFSYSLSHFPGATTKIKPCYRRKIAFSHCVGYKVYCACAVSRDLCIGGPPKPHVTIFWPQIVYSLYYFYGATMSIKDTFILEHPHVKASFGRKKTKFSQNRSPKWRFFGNLRV